MPHWIFQLSLAIALALACFFSARPLLHYYQLESYQFAGFYHAVLRNKKRALLPGVLVSIISIGLFYITFLFEDRSFGWICPPVCILISCVAGFIIARCFTDKKAKKPFVITVRVKRLMAIFALLLLGLFSCVLFLTPVAVPCAFLPLLLPIYVFLSGLIAWPIEKLIACLYFRDAQKMLDNMAGLIRIGITGSYGKTSVKFILGTILSEKYNTLITPSSYNTPMGVTKVIRQQLNPSYEVFIAEMGARHVGDIRELCHLVHPTLGVLTSVGPQHLETFKTLERIAKTKFELMDALPKDGHGFFPDDQGTALELYHKMKKPKSLVSLSDESADVWAGEVQVNPRGSSFVLHTSLGEIACETRLLGKHNIQNVLLAASVAVHLNLTLAQIKRGIAKLEPVEHRLQLLDTAGGYTVIDDAFNSNPFGANAALDVLAAFRNARRIIVTPGMVELGEKEADYNRAFGEKMASCTDIAFLIGKKHVEPIKEGLLKNGFNKDKLFHVESLDKATEILHTMMQPDDVILYENDLPDNYQEA